MANNTNQSIIAQSTLKMSQEYANSCGYCLTIKDLVSVSVVLADFCENGYSKELGERLNNVDKYLQEQYRGS